MAKKGPKESAMQQHREVIVSKQQALPFDTSAILTEIEEFKRSKVQPIKDAIQKLLTQRREIDEQLNHLNSLEAELEGRSFAPKAGGGGKRRRLTAEAKMELAKVLHGKLAGSKLNRFSSSDLKQFSDGVEPRELVELWNTKAEKGDKIHVEGEKRATRYFVGQG